MVPSRCGLPATPVAGVDWRVVAVHWAVAIQGRVAVVGAVAWAAPTSVTVVAAAAKAAVAITDPTEIA